MLEPRHQLPRRQQVVQQGQRARHQAVQVALPRHEELQDEEGEARLRLP